MAQKVESKSAIIPLSSLSLSFCYLASLAYTTAQSTRLLHHTTRVDSFSCAPIISSLDHILPRTAAAPVPPRRRSINAGWLAGLLVLQRNESYET